MLSTLRTLMIGANAAAENRLRDTHAIALITQKIRETETTLRAAKTTLASLIQRQRTEQRLLDNLTAQIADMEHRATEALSAGREPLAIEAAEAIAHMENEHTMRQSTLDRLSEKVTRLQSSVSSGHRKLIELRQGATAAKAIRQEQSIQSRLMRHGALDTSVEEAQSLIDRVLTEDDPFERAEILREINQDLDHTGLADRMAAKGFGPATKATASDVLTRLKAQRNS